MSHFLFIPDRRVRLVFLLSLGLNVASWVIALWAALPYYGKDEFMALHKTIYFGVDWIGPWYEMLFLPALGLFFIIINFFISQYLWKKDENLSHLINWSTIFIGFFIFLAVYSMARLNL